MYIFDALYGIIEFPVNIWKCIMTPEVQRLREVRLCNINSLCITGSSNTNRFEHSVGTAYLAQLNVQFNIERYMSHKDELDLFISSALLHDVANGPFGHSYEYLMEKQGFIPEKGLKSIFSGVLSYGQGANGYSSPYEQIYFGQLRALNGLFSEEQKNTISSIIEGNHFFSKLISDKIDLDNIDNVFRMAYHMGIPFPVETPIELAKSMYLENERVVFKKEAEIHLKTWFETRKRVYKFLLLNPQEYAGKYMLTEAMDIVFEDKYQNNNPYEIKWYYTDYELLESLYMQTEKWINRKCILKKNIGYRVCDYLDALPEQSRRDQLKFIIESIELTTPVKDRGKSGNSNKITLSNAFEYAIDHNKTIQIKDRNMVFEISNNNLYKIIRTKYNPSQIISRLMTGNLYDCLMIIKSHDLTKYRVFLDYNKRLDIENDLETTIRNIKGCSSIKIGIHPILDYDKTERELAVLFEGNSNTSTIGVSSKDLLLGVFIKNEPYGIKSAKSFSKSNKKVLKDKVFEFFCRVLDGDTDIIDLYEEANAYGYKRY